MKTLRLDAIVIFVQDLERSSRFYAALGLHLFPEQHGKGPAHLSADCDGVLIELYPVPRGAATGTIVRLTFRVEDLTGTLARLAATGATVRDAAATTEGGERAVVLDPDGHPITLQADVRRPGPGVGATRR